MHYFPVFHDFQIQCRVLNLHHLDMLIISLNFMYSLWSSHHYHHMSCHSTGHSGLHARKGKEEANVTLHIGGISVMEITFGLSSIAGLGCKKQVQHGIVG